MRTLDVVIDDFKRRQQVRMVYKGLRLLETPDGHIEHHLLTRVELQADGEIVEANEEYLMPKLPHKSPLVGMIYACRVVERDGGLIFLTDRFYPSPCMVPVGYFPSALDRAEWQLKHAATKYPIGIVDDPAFTGILAPAAKAIAELPDKEARAHAFAVIVAELAKHV